MIVAAVATAAVLALAACSKAPSSDEIAAWRDFAQYRQSQHAATPVAGPRSVKEYVLGAAPPYATRYKGADSILTGKFTGATTVLDPETGTSEVMATFSIHKPVMGRLTGEVVVDIGDAPPGVDMDKAVRGAGDAVIFLVDDGGVWKLSDGLYAICPVYQEGRLSMPLVDPGARGDYLASVTDVADVQALLIAGAHDPGGVLDGGVNDQQQKAIDKATDLVDP